MQLYRSGGWRRGSRKRLKIGLSHRLLPCGDVAGGRGARARSPRRSRRPGGHPITIEATPAIGADAGERVPAGLLNSPCCLALLPGLMTGR